MQWKEEEPKEKEAANKRTQEAPNGRKKTGRGTKQETQGAGDRRGKNAAATRRKETQSRRKSEKKDAGDRRLEVSAPFCLVIFQQNIKTKIRYSE